MSKSSLGALQRGPAEGLLRRNDGYCENHHTMLGFLRAWRSDSNIRVLLA
jgi:hypothetical protein